MSISKYTLVFVFFLITILTNLNLNAIPGARGGEKPDKVALDIMQRSLASFRTFRREYNIKDVDVPHFIKEKLTPYIDVETGAKYVLKDYYDELSPKQQMQFQKYLLNKIITDYARFITYDYGNISQVQILLAPNTIRKNNKAIVNLQILATPDTKPVLFSLRMIKKDAWQIYDLMIAGVSLMKNHRAVFRSHIKRKGLTAFIKDIENSDSLKNNALTK